MIRSFTTLCVLAAIGSGFYLFQTKNTAMLLDRDIARIMKQVDQARERTGLMRAEYARLTGPGPIGELAAEHLPGLRATLPTQYAALGDLGHKLPAIGAAQPVQPLEAQAPDAAPPRAAPARVEPIKGEPVKGEPGKAEPGKVEPARPAAVAAVQHPAGVTGPAAAPVVAAAKAVPVVSRPAPVVAQAAPVTVPVVAQVARPAARSALAGSGTSTGTGIGTGAGASNGPAAPVVMPAVMRAPPATPAEAVARIARGEPVNPSVPAVASALGMARTMTPSAISPVQAASLQPGSLR